MTDLPPAVPNLRQKPGVLVCSAIAGLLAWYVVGFVAFAVWRYAP